MKYTKTVSVSGGWVKKDELRNGQRAKIVSEAEPIPSNFIDSKGNPTMQDVAKVHFEGQKEPVNVNLNRATIGALIDAFGDDSKEWMGKYLTVETEKVRVAGKAVTALYLIPEGYKKVDDDNGYAVIVKNNPEIPVIDDEKPDTSDIPF